MSQDRLHTMGDHSQPTILKVLIKYCEQNARDIALIDQLKVGVCAGMITLDAYANYVSELNEKSELPLPKDDLHWLNNIKHKLSTWKLNQPFPMDPEDPFIQDIERFLSHLIGLGNYIYKPLSLLSWDLETLLLDTHDRTFKSVLRLAEPINFTDLSEQVESLVTENTWTAVAAGRHNSYLRMNNETFIYYDPNSKSSKKEFKNKFDSKLALARHIFLKHFKYNLQKSSQFIFNSYRFAKLSEEKTDKKEVKLDKSGTTELLELRLLRKLRLDKEDEKSININEKAPRWFNLTILAHAIHNQLPLPVIQYFLDNGANPNIEDESKHTALHNLQFLKNDSYKLEITFKLLKAGANPHAKANNFITPIFLAMINAAIFYQDNSLIDTPRRV